MTPISRRSFAAAAAAAGLAQARTLSSIGAQLYTLRDVLPKKPLETLQAIERIGYREAEVIRAHMDFTWPALLKTRLKPVSLHMDTALFTRDQDKLGPALEDAKKRGFAYVVCPYIAPQDRGGVEVIKKLAAALTKAGERCRAMGVALCYHNHAFEFEPAGNGTLLDVLMRESDPKLVGLELDIMWAQVAGVAPASVLKQYGSRTPLMHLKNVSAGVEKRYNEGVPRESFQEVGKGVIDVAAVLRAAAAAGVKHYFVEQDQTPGDPLDSLRGSFEYLRKLSF